MIKIINALFIISITFFLLSFSLNAKEHHRKDREKKAEFQYSINIDFGNRVDTTFHVPSQFFGAGFGHFGTYQDSAWNLLRKAGIVNVRFDANIPSVFKTQTPDWSSIDTLVSQAAKDSLHPIMILDYTPLWLQPAVNPCDSVIPQHDEPTDLSKWAGIAAQYVHHMDSVFPGVVQNYEIWNEPDGPSFLCASSNSERLAIYDSLFTITAAKIREQANIDKSNIKIGGPALANPSGHAAGWLSYLLNDTSAAKYIDFISYHHYLSGCVWPGNWDSMVALTQNNFTGVKGVFNRVADIVRNGKQPNPTQTPIYIDEFNTSACNGGMDPYRNSSVYAPIWNGLFITDLLNAAYESSHSIPSKLLYFSSSNPTHGFCLLGLIDPNMDCNTSKNQMPQPYPQYYLYRLIGGSDYMDITNNCYLASSVVSPTDSLNISAFYNKNSENILIVNPTTAAFSNVMINVSNSGLVPSEAVLFSLNKTYPNITKSSLSFNLFPGGYSFTLNIPPLSVLGIKYSNEITKVDETNMNIPNTFSLSQNYPNPFNPSTEIRYQLAEPGYVTLKVFDTMGKEIKVLVNQYQIRGYYSVKFDASNLASGVYFYELMVNNFISTRKMIVIK